MDTPEQSPPPRHFYSSLSEQLGPKYDFIPPKYLYQNLPPYLRELTQPDTLCSLPLLTEKTRTDVISRISRSIQKGETVAIAKQDSDQLKTANTKISHEFGNESIRISAANFIQAVSDLNLSCDHFIFRSTTGGDELLFFAFNPIPDEVEKIKMAVVKINQTTQKVNVQAKKADQEFTFSSSVGLAITDEPAFATQTKQTQEALSNHSIPQAYDQTNDLVQKAEDRAGSIKVLHEISAIEIPKLLQMTPLEYKQYLAESFGGSRTSRAGWNILIMIDQIITAKYLKSQDYAKKLPAPELEDISANYPEGGNILKMLVDTYNHLF